MGVQEVGVQDDQFANTTDRTKSKQNEGIHGITIKMSFTGLEILVIPVCTTTRKQSIDQRRVQKYSQGTDRQRKTLNGKYVSKNIAGY